MSEKNQGYAGSFRKEEVESLAKKLEEWSKKDLSAEERQLLEFLVARAELPWIERTEELIVIDKSIKEAAYSALAAFIDSKKQERGDYILWRRTSAATR